MIATARGRQIPTLVGESCQYGYTLLAGKSLDGFALIRTPKGSFSVVWNAWGKGEKIYLSVKARPDL